MSVPFTPPVPSMSSLPSVSSVITRTSLAAKLSPAPALVDPRSPRLGAVITTVVLAAALITQTAVPPVSIALLVVQAAVFALGAAGSSPYGVLFKRVIRPRLAPPTELEDSRPLRFAQTVGFGFAVLALVGLALPTTVVTTVALAFALAAAFLNAAFGI